MEFDLSYKQLEKKAYLICAFCFLGAFLGSYFLSQDLNEQEGGSQGSAIGSIKKMQLKVRRKSSDSFIWRRLITQDLLYSKDTLQTGNLSSALIHMKDGSEIELSQNSIVVFTSVADLPLSFIKGEGIIRNGNIKKRVTFSKTGVQKIEQLPVTLLEPQSATHFFVGLKASKKVTFQWVSPQPKIDPTYLLEISSNPLFLTKGPSTLAFNLKETTKSVELTQGTYYWRVSQNHQPSETLPLILEEIRPAQNISPSQKEVISYWGDDTSVSFRWLNPQDPSSTSLGEHTLEVATDLNFSHPFIHQLIDIKTENAIIPHLNQGVYYWRIVSRYLDSQENFLLEGSPVSFEVKRKKNPTIALKLPAPQATLSSASPVLFSWETDADSKDTFIEIKNEQEKVTRFTTTSNRFQWDKPYNGAFQWRVLLKASDIVLQQSAWQDLRLFDGKPIALLSPTANQSIYAWKAPLAVSFHWQEQLLPNTKYLLEISEYKNFQSLSFKRIVSEPQINVTELKWDSHLYFWRVTL